MPQKILEFVNVTHPLNKLEEGVIHASVDLI